MNATAATSRFCARCGGALATVWHAQDRRERLTCGHCGAIHYDNPKILVWCFVHCGEALLMCKRAIEPAKGLWNPPAGFERKRELTCPSRTLFCFGWRVSRT